MANPFGEKNIGPWEGQQVEYIPLDDLVLWTENPRDPLDGDYTNDDVIRRATDGRNEKQWQLSKLSKEMGDRFDLSELPTVCRIDDGPKYRVYDGNRRVILAMLRKAVLTTEGQQQRELAGKDTIRRHADSMFSYCGFGRTQCADMREIDAEVEAAPIPKAPEHANIDLSGLLTEEDIRLYQAASEATPHGKIRPVNPHACRKVYAVLDLLRERFTVEWDPESKGYRKAIRRPR